MMQKCIRISSCLESCLCQGGLLGYEFVQNLSESPEPAVWFDVSILPKRDLQLSNVQECCSVLLGKSVHSRLFHSEMRQILGFIPFTGYDCCLTC